MKRKVLHTALVKTAQDPELLRMQRAADPKRAFMLRAEGKSPEEIGQELGVDNVTTVNALIRRGYDLEPEEFPDDVRKRDLRLLDDMQSALAPYAKGIVENSGERTRPEINAINAILAIQRRRHELLGLNAPAKMPDDPMARLAQLLGKSIEALPPARKMTVTKTEMTVEAG